jgi:hypothetical protein
LAASLANSPPNLSFSQLAEAHSPPAEMLSMPAVFIDYTVVFLINLTTPDEIKYTLPTLGWGLEAY